MRYKVKLISNGNIIITFETNDLRDLEESWKKDGKLCVIQPNGKKIFHNLSLFQTMEVEEMEK